MQNPLAANHKNLELEKFQAGPRHHEKDLYELRERRERVQLLGPRNSCRVASEWLHVDTFLSRSESNHFRTLVHSQSYGRFASLWIHLDIYLSRSESSHFRTLVHPPKAMADLLPYGFTWTSFCPDPDQSIFEPSNPSTPFKAMADSLPYGF